MKLITRGGPQRSPAKNFAPHRKIEPRTPAASGALDHADVQRASHVMLAAAEAILDEVADDIAPAVVCVGAGAVLDQAVATALAARLSAEGVSARPARQEDTLPADAPAAILVLARHATPRRVRRAMARLRLRIAADVPVFVAAESDAAMEATARATGAAEVVPYEAVCRAVERYVAPLRSAHTRRMEEAATVSAA